MSLSFIPIQRMKRINLEVFDTIVNLPSIPSVDPSAIPVYDTVFIQQLFEYEQEVYHSVEISKPENKSITFQKKIDFSSMKKKKKTFLVTAKGCSNIILEINNLKWKS